MALQIRRGLQADLPASPADGELLYATDTNKLYVGDGGTAQEISGGTGGGLGNVVEDLTPQLGGNLDVNGNSIISAGGADININPSLGGDVVLHGNLVVDNLGNLSKTGQLNISPTTSTTFGRNDTLVDGNIYITRNSYASTAGSGFTFAQHHNTADAVNFGFYRSRGTGSAQTAVVNGDDLGDITFNGFDGTGTAGGATISATVDGNPLTGRIPTKFSFFTNNGVNQIIRAELSSGGVWKVNNLQNLTGDDLTLTATNVKIVGDVQINARGDLRFADADSTNWVALQAPGTIATNITWTLPATDGASGEVLSTNGSGTLAWAAVASGTTLSTRASVAGTSASLANGASGDVDITGFKGYMLYKIQTSVASWVRLYTDSASRTADNSRSEGTDPAPGAGVIAEIITTGASTILISPGAFGFNNESSPTSNIPVRVTNKSGAASTVTVTLVVVQLEA
jgi:hypothetical protein